MSSISSKPPNVTENLVRALVLYSLAEFQLGYANWIRVTTQGQSFSIEDNGRGHPIDRTVEGSPYLDFIYNHLDYPFSNNDAKPIQLHGIGMSLLNGFCAELTVNIRKKTATLRMNFQLGRLVKYEFAEITAGVTGNLLSGRVHTNIESRPVDEQALRVWLLKILVASPSLRLYFNGQELRSAPA